MSLKYIDPIYYLLQLILRPFYSSSLGQPERRFLEQNTNKTRGALWVNILAIFTLVLGFKNIAPGGIDAVVLALIAPVTVTGAAWFGISFGGVPAKLVSVAMQITFWLFTAFAVSLSAMFISVGFITPPLIWPALAVIYVGVLVSCIQYDMADGLKVGLDEALLRHSRAALVYYQKQGIDPATEDQSRE